MHDELQVKVFQPRQDVGKVAGRCTCVQAAAFINCGWFSRVCGEGGKGINRLKRNSFAELETGGVGIERCGYGGLRP